MSETTITCPTCGEKVTVEEGADDITCPNCGARIQAAAAKPAAPEWQRWYTVRIKAGSYLTTFGILLIACGLIADASACVPIGIAALAVGVVIIVATVLVGHSKFAKKSSDRG